MTYRERTALILLALGVVCSSVAAYGYGGWRALCGVVGVILLGIGVLLALDTTPPAPPEPAELLIDDETEDGVQRG